MQRVPLHSGFVSPCEARLALAQCGVALTAAEALVLGDVLAGGAFGERLSTRSQWAISELLEAMDVAPLAGGAAGAARARRGDGARRWRPWRERGGGRPGCAGDVGGVKGPACAGGWSTAKPVPAGIDAGTIREDPIANLGGSCS